MGGLLPTGDSMWDSMQRALGRAEKAEARVQVLEEVLRYLADPGSWLGDPHSQETWLHGHDTPFELAVAALASEGTPEEAKNKPLVHILGGDGGLLCGERRGGSRYCADFLASKLATCPDCAARL